MALGTKIFGKRPLSFGLLVLGFVFRLPYADDAVAGNPVRLVLLKPLIKACRVTPQISRPLHYDECLVIDFPNIVVICIGVQNRL